MRAIQYQFEFSQYAMRHLFIFYFLNLLVIFAASGAVKILGVGDRMKSSSLNKRQEANGALVRIFDLH